MTTSDSGSGPWEPGRLRLFMSHLAVHQGLVGQVGQLLSATGINGFVAHTSIEPTHQWQNVIETALATCDAMAVFLHEGFHESLWCDQEVGFAYGRGVPIISLAFDVFPYGFLSRYQAVRAASLPVYDIAGKIVDSLAAVELSADAQERLTEGLVTGFEQTSSYEGARQNFGRLSKVQRFKMSQLDRLTATTSENNQVSNAGLRTGLTVPDAIAQLVARHEETALPD